MPDRIRTLTVSVDPDSIRPSVLQVSGELDHHTAPRLRAALDELPADAGLVLDLTDLDYCDSSGITVLVSAQQRAQGADSSLSLVGLDPELVRHFRIIGLGDVFALHATVEDAVRASRS